MEKKKKKHSKPVDQPSKSSWKLSIINRESCILCSKLISSISIATNSIWVLVWLVLSMVEEDVKDDVNLYLMRELKLVHLVDIFSILKGVHLSLIVISFAVFICYMFCSNLYTFYIIQIVNLVVIIYNIFFFYYIISTGYIVWHLFLLSLPLLTVRFFYHYSIIIFLVVGLWSIVSWYKFKHIPRNRCSAKLVYSLVVMLLFVSAIVSLIKIGCYSCNVRSSLPSKPGLTAHRGCPHSPTPENSLAAFHNAAEIQGVVTLESDVHLSHDGVLFLLHDPTLFRTTSFTKQCPQLSPYTIASTLSYYSGPCPLVNLTLLPGSEDSSSTGSTGSGASSGIPTLEDLLVIAKKNKKNVIFDLARPSNKYSTFYVSYTLQAVLKSGINLNKVWWLEEHNRSRISAKYPGLTLAAKSSFTSFKQFQRNNISIANEHWSTTGDIIKRLQSLRMAINMYTIDSVVLYEYAWCLGVDTVTTNNCQLLNDHIHNYLHEACHSILLATPWLLILIVALLCLSILTI